MHSAHVTFGRMSPSPACAAIPTPDGHCMKGLVPHMQRARQWHNTSRPQPSHQTPVLHSGVTRHATPSHATLETDDDDAPAAGKAMRVERLLANLGYASRKDCQTLVKKGRVLGRGGARLKVGDKVFHEDMTLDGEPLDPPFPMSLMLHKPVGYVVTSPDDERISDPKIYDLLPHRYGARRPFLSSIGRLDKDTSGLLLLTDDGQLVHRVKSPKQGIWKVYEARLSAPLTDRQVAAAAKRFASGSLTLVGDLQPLLPAALAMKDDQTALLTIMEGRYHQVRRMFTAMGHEVLALHRTHVGGLALPGDLGRGEYRSLTAADLEAVFNGPSTEEVLGRSTGPQAPGFTPAALTAPHQALQGTHTPQAAEQGKNQSQPNQAPLPTGQHSLSEEQGGSAAAGNQGNEVEPGAQSDAGVELAELQLAELREGVKAYRVGERRLRRVAAFKRRATPE